MPVGIPKASKLSRRSSLGKSCRIARRLNTPLRFWNSDLTKKLRSKPASRAEAWWAAYASLRMGKRGKLSAPCL